MAVGHNPAAVFIYLASRTCPSMRKRIFFKLFLLIIMVVGVSTAALDILVRRSWEASLSAQLQRDIEDKVKIFAGLAHRESGSILFQQLAPEVATAAYARSSTIDCWACV